MKISKKLFIPVALILILLIIFGFNHIKSNDTIKSGNDITMFIATDSHYFDKSLSDNSEGFSEFAVTRDGKQLIYSEEIMDAFANDIKTHKPDILIVSGDLTNNGEKLNHLELAKKFNNIEKSGTRVYVIPGNHDVLSLWSTGYKDGLPNAVQNIDHQEFKEIYKDFGYNEAISHDLKTQSYLAAPSEDLWLLMLDSNKYFSEYSMPTGSGFITDETIEWIKASSHMAEEEGAKIIAVMHHPLMQHSLRNVDGTIISNSQNIVELFKELDIEITFSGHIHIQDIKTDDIENPKIYDIVNSALSVYPHQYGVLNYSPNSGYVYSKLRVDVERWAKEEGLTDPNLLGFSEYAARSFGKRPYNRAVEDLSQLGTYSDLEIEDLSLLVRDINLMHFEGTLYSSKKDLMASPIYKEFIKTKSESLYDFVYGMVHSVDLDSTYLKLDK